MECLTLTDVEREMFKGFVIIEYTDGAIQGYDADNDIINDALNDGHIVYYYY